jgi:hypothetical protein
MLKDRRIVAFFALCAICAIWIYWWASSGFPLEGQICEIPEPPKNCGSHNVFFYSAYRLASIANQWGVLITAFATVAIGYFTYTLFITSATQAQLTRESIDLARQEFISTHRPKIIVYGVDFGGTPNDSEQEIPVTFRYVNSGVATAYVTQIGTRVIHLFKSTLPNDVQFRIAQLPYPIEVKSGMHAFAITVDTMPSTSPNLLKALEGVEKVVCVGYLVYEDDNGTKRQTGFCRAYDRSSNRWQPMNDDDYEYSY